MSIDSGYDYLAVHGHRRRFYIECTLWPLHFRNLWEAIGKKLQGKRLAAAVFPGNAFDKEELTGTIRWSEFGKEFIRIRAADLPTVHVTCKAGSLGRDFVWLDLHKGYDDYSRVNRHIADPHHNPYVNQGDFISRSGNSILCRIHDDDFAYLYVRQEQTAKELIEYELVNFFKNKYGYGFFQRPHPRVLFRIARTSFRPLPVSIVDALFDIMLTTGFTCYVEDLQVASGMIKLKLWRGIPRFVIRKSHPRVDEVNQNLTLAFNYVQKRWTLGSARAEIPPRERVKRITHG